MTNILDKIPDDNYFEYDEKKGVPVNKYSIDDILKLIGKLFIPNIELPNIPSQLILIGSKTRGGLSPRTIASRIISRQVESGAHSGPMNDGSDNISEKMELIRVEEIIYALQNEAKVDVVINSGQQVTGTFAGIGSGPINGMTITTGKGNAIIR